METSIRWIVVVCLAGGAHREDTHSRLVAVIGHILNNREARAAVGAVDERIAVTAVLRIKELMQAIITNGGIRRDKRLAFGTSLTMGNSECVFMTRRYLFD